MMDLNRSGAITVALGAVAITAGPASAGVVVTTVDLQLSTLTAPFQFGAGQFAVSPSGPTGLYTLSSVSPSLIASHMDGPFHAATKLTSGTSISASTFASSGTKGIMESPSTPNPFFAALDLVIGPDNFYGWALFNDTAGNGLFFDAYAFETTANTPLTTPSVPEPAGLSLLALGAAGALAVRRRKRVLN